MEENKSRQLSKIDFDDLRQYIENRSGINIDEDKRKSFEINLHTRMRALGVNDYSSYCSLITRSTERKEFETLLDLILIKETFFFRDERQLNVLTKNILTELAEAKKGKEIKIWSSGCATGEEPYSISMAIMETFPPGNINVSIYATDISTENLSKAREGIYNKNSMRVIDNALLGKYFMHRDSRYYLSDQIKQLVHFDTHNLIDHSVLAGRESFDIVFCRNVIIYFKIETVKAVIQKFYDTLTMGGYLFLGHSESLWQISDQFELVEIGETFLYRKKEKYNSVFQAKRFQKEQRKSSNIVKQRRNPHSFKKETRPQAASTPRAAGGKNLRQNPKPTHKKDLSALIKEGLQPQVDGNRDAILEKIEEILEEDHRNVEAHLLAGKIYADIGLYDKSLKKGMDVLEINDLCAEAYLLIGSINYKIGEKEKAVSSFKKVIYLDDKSALSHYYLGNIYKDSNQIKQAVKEYKNVIHIFETYTESKEWIIGEVFSTNQLKDICVRNIEILSKNMPNSK